MNSLYEKLVDKWTDVTDLPPQTVGPMTPYYKMVTKRLKVMPWPLLIVGGITLVALLYGLFGSGITFLTTLLQKSF